MNKKLLSSLLLLFAIGVGYSQTIVSTTPENKKVVLEEFTGINCVFCPEGHAIAQNIQNNNPGNVFLINIHTGGFANPSGSQPDFRTPFGAAIASQSQLVGYPAGTVNRHFFPGQAQNGGSGTAMSRGQWTSASNETLGESSYLNMAVEADIDVQTNELTVHVEAYYTGNSPEATNMLNVALLQNNTLGPQTGGNMGNEYVHMHRLVHMVTGQWGESISPTTTGTFIDRTYTYTIPADYNGIECKIEDLELVVFMTETTQELISGNGAYPTYSNFPFNNDVNANYVVEIQDQCGIDLEPQINIQNTGNNEVTSVDIEYSVNGGPTQSYTWTGSLLSLENETVTLPAISYTAEEVNTVSISLGADDDMSNNDIDANFDRTQITTNDLTLLLNTDFQASQVSWEIINTSGEVVESGSGYDNNENYNIPLSIPGGCYQFNLYDTGGNGGGSVVLYDSESNVVYQTSGNYGAGGTANFATDGFLGTGDNALSGVAIYPNPASKQINVKNAENANVQIFDIMGRIVFAQQSISSNEQIAVDHLLTGSYFVKITKNNEVSIEKLIINH